VTFKPKLVAFDLDGTLAESKQPMEPKMGELLAQLLQKMPVAVMSGAGFPQFEKQFIPALPPATTCEKLYLFPDNAAQCYIFEAGKWRTRYDNAFSPNERDHILKELNEAMKETGFAEAPVRVWGQRVEDRGAEIVFSGLGQQAPIEEKKKWDPTHEKRQPLADALRRRLPEVSVAVNASTSIDITPKGITKAYGIKKLVELSGISVSEMLYVGDALGEGGNDAVVIESGVKTQQVFGPEETAALIKDILDDPTLGR
jgi:HAD superfamily hydrolase (TIGR01484 family)